MSSIQNQLKGRILGLAEMADMFCVVHENHIFMSNGAVVIIPTNKNMQDVEMATYLNNLAYSLNIGDFDVNASDPDLVDKLYEEVKEAVVEQKARLSEKDYVSFRDRLQTVQETLDTETSAYTAPKDVDDAKEIVAYAEQDVSQMLQIIKHKRELPEEEVLK